jgi:hypothetical protein
MNEPIYVWVADWDSSGPSVHRSKQSILDFMESDGVEEPDIEVNTDEYIYVTDYLRAERVELVD